MSFRNCIETGYPFVEAILSTLPLCDEYLINDGGSDDGTFEILKRLGEMFPDKIRIFNIPDYISERWECVSEQYNKLISESVGDWIFQGNADELIHEDDIIKFKQSIVSESKADVIRYPRREVVKNWSGLSEYIYYPARVARNIQGLHQKWQSHGGDEFIDSIEWMRYPPRAIKKEIMIWHLYGIFPANVPKKREKDAFHTATINRAKIYESAKHRKPKWIEPINVLPNLPILVQGLVGMFEYRVRDDLLDQKNII